MNQELLLYLTSVVAFGVAAQWLAWRLRLPSILLLLAFGVGLGTLLAPALDVGSVFPDEILFPIVSLSVAVILFEGGLTLRLSELRDVGGIVLRLVTLGALVSWVATSLAGIWILRLDSRLSTLLGAVLVVTGPTVVGPMLRQIRPSRRVASMLKWEGIVIDPIGALLAVLVFEFVRSAGLAEGAVRTGLAVASAMLGGGVIGGLAALLLVRVVHRFLAPDHLHVPIFLATALVAFTLSNRLQPESGLVAVTVMGVALANQRLAPVKHVVEFKENLQVLLIGTLFIALGSRTDGATLTSAGWRALAFVAAIILVIRPLSVFVATIGAPIQRYERLFLAFLAPRGIVAASVATIFALELSVDQELPPSLREQSPQVAVTTFWVIIGTVSTYGLFAGMLARRLGLATANPQGLLIAGADPWVCELALVLQRERFAVHLIDTNYANVVHAQRLGLPAECANILADYVYEELDMAGLGSLLALTSNDEVNTLAVREFAHFFGRANSYQLTPEEKSLRRQMKPARHLRGRTLFERRLTCGEFERRVAQGDEFKSARITAGFSWDTFRRQHGDTTVVLFVISDTGRLQINTPQRPIVPAAGQTVIALVPKAAREDVQVR